MSLTKKDLQAIAELVDNSISKNNLKLDKKFRALEIKNQIGIENIVDEISQQMQDWRSDFYDKIDPVLKEVQSSFEERAINAHRISEHEDKLENHEKRISNLEI